MGAAPANVELMTQALALAASLGTSAYLYILAWRSPEILRVFLTFVRGLINDWHKRRS
jgi:hypothetical protein